MARLSAETRLCLVCRRGIGLVVGGAPPPPGPAFLILARRFGLKQLLDDGGSRRFQTSRGAWRAGCNDPSTALARFGAKLDQMICAGQNFGMMLDDDKCVA